MAPNRKKKKPAANPARGVATTSTASKSKLNDDISSQDTLPVIPTAGGSNLQAADAAILTQPEKELCDLSPDELERQLQESELQLLVEKHAEKTKRDIARQVTRLQTERRLLRPQAGNLNISVWLTCELRTKILSHLGGKGSSTPYEYKPIRSQTSMEDLCIRTWTLCRALIDLGFTNERVQPAVSNLLLDKQMRELAYTNLSKESLWGIDECFDYLALQCSPEEVPDYESHVTKAKQAASSEFPDIDFTHEAGKMSDLLIEAISLYRNDPYCLTCLALLAQMLF